MSLSARPLRVEINREASPTPPIEMAEQMCTRAREAAQLARQDARRLAMFGEAVADVMARRIETMEDNAYDAASYFRDANDALLDQRNAARERTEMFRKLLVSACVETQARFEKANRPLPEWCVLAWDIVGPPAEEPF